MKILLACLMCLVLTMAECFALKGGPVYPGQTNVVGTYAGTIEGPANSLGIFTLPIPQTGTSAGTFVLFDEGRTFQGTIQGVADPDSAQFSGLVSADATVTELFLGELVTFVAARADGSMTAFISSMTSSFSNSTRLNGTAFVSVRIRNSEGNFDPPMTTVFTVSGFKQSNSTFGSG